MNSVINLSMSHLLYQVRESTLMVENCKYYSIELRGPILPTTVHNLFKVLRTSSSAQFSATFAHQQQTLAFSWAAKPIAEGTCFKYCIYIHTLTVLVTGSARKQPICAKGEYTLEWLELVRFTFAVFKFYSNPHFGLTFSYVTDFTNYQAYWFNILSSKNTSSDDAGRGAQTKKWVISYLFIFSRWCCMISLRSLRSTCDLQVRHFNKE